MLLLNLNQPVSADRLVDALWDNPPDTALGQVQTRIWRLRQLLHGPAGESADASDHPQLITRSGGYALMADPATVDLLVFDRRVRDAAAMLLDDCAREAAAELRQALSLFRGPCFANLNAPGVVAEAALVEERRMAALQQRIEIELNLGMHARLIAELRELVAANPYQERLRLHLMHALHRSGRRAEAVAAYREGHRVMVDGAGLEPSRELKELHRAILLSDVPTQTATPAPAAEEASAWARKSRDLPYDTTLLVGRCEEVGSLLTHFRAGDPATGRIVAIAGVPGVGKTVLAVRVAQMLGHEALDGQLFAWLGGKSDPSSVLHRFLRTLGIPEREVPSSLHERSVLFRACMANRRAVLVLDDARSEADVRPLLPAGPASMTLVTSRRPLTALDGAYQLELRPLTDGEGVRLFTEIVGQERCSAEPDELERIVTHCEGLPLAIRAAAARLRARAHWSLSRFAETVENRVQRLDALSFGDLDVRAAIASSYAQLGSPARDVFRKLGRLAAGEFTTADVARLAGVPPFVAEELTEELYEARLVLPLTEVDDHVHGEVLRYSIGELCRLVALEREIFEQP
jgi:DNA-binding SARP family transcriptional activator